MNIKTIANYAGMAEIYSVATTVPLLIIWNVLGSLPCELSVLFSFILFCSVQFCSVQFHSFLFCSVLFHSVSFCSVSFSSLLFCAVLFHSVSFATVLFCFVLLCSLLSPDAYGRIWIFTNKKLLLAYLAIKIFLFLLISAVM